MLIFVKGKLSHIYTFNFFKYWLQLKVVLKVMNLNIVLCKTF